MLPFEMYLQPEDWPDLEDLLHRPEWHKDAACAGHPDLTVDDFHPGRDSGGRSEAARGVCARCLVQAECLDAALAVEASTDHGIWGGTSARERVAIRRRPPSSLAG